MPLMSKVASSFFSKFVQEYFDKIRIQAWNDAIDAAAELQLRNTAFGKKESILSLKKKEPDK